MAGRDGLSLMLWEYDAQCWIMDMPAKSTVRQREFCACPLPGAHTDIWLEGEDLGSSLLLCPGKTFSKETKISFIVTLLWHIQRYFYCI